MDDFMMTFQSPREISLQVARNVQQQRLRRNLTQEELASRSGVPLGTLRLFERTGRISLGGLIKLAMALGEEGSMLKLMESRDPESLFDVHKGAPKKRLRASGRKGSSHV
ncbi:MAG: helix-turn-helix domain-containing protein [Leptospirales bacterium]